MSSAPTSVDIGTLIWKNPAKGGRACLAGRNITVSRIVNLWCEPLTPEQIAEDAFGLDVVSVADVYAALAYYHANQQEIEDEIAAASANMTRHTRTTKADSSPPDDVRHLPGREPGGRRLVGGLEAAGIVVVRSVDVGMAGKLDPEQLTYAAENDFAVYTENARGLHTSSLGVG